VKSYRIFRRRHTYIDIHSSNKEFPCPAAATSMKTVCRGGPEVGVGSARSSLLTIRILEENGQSPAAMRVSGGLPVDVDSSS